MPRRRPRKESARPVPPSLKIVARALREAALQGELPFDTQLEACLQPGPGAAVNVVAWAGGQEVGRWQLTG